MIIDGAWLFVHSYVDRKCFIPEKQTRIDIKICSTRSFLDYWAPQSHSIMGQGFLRYQLRFQHYMSSSSRTSNAQQNWSFPKRIKPFPSRAQAISLVSKFSAGVNKWLANTAFKIRLTCRHTNTFSHLFFPRVSLPLITPGINTLIPTAESQITFPHWVPSCMEYRLSMK